VGARSGAEALEAVADAVAYAETFGDDSGQVGEVFEVYRGWGRWGSAWLLSSVVSLCRMRGWRGGDRLLF
jgi:hypothetical protein